MNCIIVDDEPLARKAIQSLIETTALLKLTGSFSDALAAKEFMLQHQVDLIFSDIRMPQVDGIEFAKTISNQTLVIFTTAYSEYALDSYEVDAIDYLVKPVEPERFQKAVDKAKSYHDLLQADNKKNHIESFSTDYMFIKADRRYFKIFFKDILFIEGLKDYIVIQIPGRRLITKMAMKTIYEQLPSEIFFRVNKSYIVNTGQISSFDNNDIFIGSYEIPIGSTYRDMFFEKILGKR